MTPEDHAAAVAGFRAERDRRLRDPDGWLTLVGLHWLEPGANRVGSAPDGEVVLSFPGVPALAGVLSVEGTAARWKPVDGGAEVELTSDDAGEPTVLATGTLRMHVICRGERLALRVRDHASPACRSIRWTAHGACAATWKLRRLGQRSKWST